MNNDPNRIVIKVESPVDADRAVVLQLIEETLKLYDIRADVEVELPRRSFLAQAMALFNVAAAVKNKKTTVILG